MRDPVRSGIEGLNYLNIQNIPVLPLPRGNRGTRKKRRYKDCICAFDIETTTDGDVNYMYVWQFQFDEYLTITGRTWDEFRTLVHWLCDHADGGAWLVYVHNLSYEFQYLRGIYDFGPDEVFATDSRKVLKCEMFDCVEFRCSQFLSNMSLANFTKTMRVDHVKRSGADFDYSIVRYPWTELTEEEWKYCTYDVIGLVEAVKALMRAGNDDIYSVPLTSTGQPRRDIKRLMRTWSRWKLQAILPDYEIFRMLREAYRGGNTHASRFWAGKIVSAKEKGCRILSADRSSSYPDVLVNRPYPMSKWLRLEHPDPAGLVGLVRDGKAVLFRAGFENVRLRSESWPVPYLSRDKCRQISGGVWDNGRILSADYLETTLTDIDFRILLEEYDFDDLVVGDVCYCDYKPLPVQFTAMVNRYYHMKTKYKGVEGQEITYALAKAKLNSLYGMTAQVPVKQEMKYISGEWVETATPEEELLEKHNRTAWSSYAWGCWCTAWARYELERGIRKAEEYPFSFLYCDTDSVKYIDRGQDWTEMNDGYRRSSEKKEAAADDPQGVRHWMGVYEADGEYSRFVTLGAKRYAYEDEDGRLHITVSGVGKKAGAEELGRLENFREGFVWYHGGKTESKYIDDPPERWIEREGRKIEITPHIIISDTTYTLELSDDYRDLVNIYLK